MQTVPVTKCNKSPESAGENLLLEDDGRFIWLPECYCPSPLKGFFPLFHNCVFHADKSTMSWITPEGICEDMTCEEKKEIIRKIRKLRRKKGEIWVKFHDSSSPLFRFCEKHEKAITRIEISLAFISLILFCIGFFMLKRLR